MPETGLARMPDAALAPATTAVQSTEIAEVIKAILAAATNPNVNIDVIKALRDLHRDLVQERAEQQFNDAMNVIQSNMDPILADARNPQTKSKYASHAALDHVLRPLYTGHGISLSYDTDDCPDPGSVRVVCYASRGPYTRKYKMDIPADGKGAKGGEVMTRTHAVGSALTYGKRYLLGSIFNIAIDRDDDGNAASISQRAQARAPEPVITPEQARAISMRLVKMNADIERFLGVVGGVESVSDIPAKLYDHVIEIITAAENNPERRKRK